MEVFFLLLLILCVSLKIEASRAKRKASNENDDVDKIPLNKLDEKLKDMKNNFKNTELTDAERSQLANEYQKLKNDVNKISKTKGLFLFYLIS